MSQFTTWRDGGGIADIPALTGAVTDLEIAAIGASLGVLSDADVARLKTAVASLLAAAKRGQADPPPSCVPGLRADHKAAMAGFKKGAQGALDAVKVARSGDMQTAASEIKAAAKSSRRGARPWTQRSRTWRPLRRAGNSADCRPRSPGAAHHPWPWPQQHEPGV